VIDGPLTDKSSNQQPSNQMQMNAYPEAGAMPPIGAPMGQGLQMAVPANGATMIGAPVTNPN
jgi:hypothetical protein